MSVSNQQRFSDSNPCPVCGGYDQAERGSGERCHGWISEDGRYVHCSREEHAGSLEANTSSGTYTHYLGGQCKCGKTHGNSPNGKVVNLPTKVRKPANLDPEKDKIFWYRDLSGAARCAAVRFGGNKENAAQAYKEDGQWWLKKPDDWVLDIPYRLSEVLDAIKNGDPVHIFEGETDADAARNLGLVATTNFGGAGKFSDKLVPFFSGATVIVNQDNDDPGKEHALDVALRLHGTASVTKVMPPFPGVAEGGDFKDWLDAGGSVEEYLRIVESAPEFVPSGALAGYGPVGTLVSEVEKKPIRWFWRRRIAQGKLNIVDGDPGLGKSLVVLDLAARASRGADMPDGSAGIPESGVVLMSAEDDIADTVRPRWERAGGDPAKLLHLFQVVRNGQERAVTIPDDLPLIEEAVERISASVVIIDPVSAFWSPDVRTHIDTEVRRALNPLKDMAERLDVTVILVRHLNKTHGGNALYRGQGSIGIIGACRCGLMIGEHPNDESIRVLAPHKTNISKKAASLRFTIHSESDDDPPKVVWGQEIDVKATDMARPPVDEEKRSALSDAVDFLMEALASGPVKADELYATAKRREISARTLRRAKDQLGVEVFRQDNVWFWRLPDGPSDGDGSQGGQPTEFGHLGHLDEKVAVLQENQGGQTQDGQDGHFGHLDTETAVEEVDAETEEKVSGIETEEDVSVADDDQGGQISEVGHLGSVYIDNAVKLERLIAALAPYQEIAIDVETYPRDEHNTALDPRRGAVRTISVAAGDDVVGVIDARAVNPRPLLDSLSGRTLVAFNAQFDLSFIRRAFGYEHDRPVADPGVLDVVLKFAGKSGARERYKDKGRIKFGFDPRRKHFRSLVAVLEDYLPNFGELKKQEQGSDWGADTLTKEQVEYAAKDARILIPLIAAVRHRFEEAGMLRVYELENRFTPALAYTQDNGFGLGVDGWRERCARQEEKDLKNLKAACDDLAPDVPEDANFNEWAWNGSSHRRVGLALALLGAKIKKNSDTGNYLTGEADLEAAAKLVRAILTYREAQKLFSTWGMSWFDLPKFRPKAKKHPYDKDHQFIVDGRVYSRFNQTVKTGRLSSDSPNFQNIPPEVRDQFIAPPGRQLVIGDYKQLEYVVLAILAQEDVLMDGFRRGDDVHVRVARTVFGIQGEVSKVDRKKAKEVSFGIVYGISSGGLATRLSRTTGTEFSKDDAQDLMDTYLDALPKVKLWYQTEKDLALSKNDVTKTMAGRERLLDLKLSKRGKWYVEPSLRLNTPVQGSAGDGFKYATALAHESKDECPGSPMIVNMVHDELVIEVDEDHVGDATEWLEKCMIDGMAEVLGKGARDLINVDMRDGKVWREPAED